MRFLYFSLLLIFSDPIFSFAESPAVFMDGSDLEKRVADLEHAMKQVGTSNESGSFGARFGRDEKDGIGLQFFGCPLYWNAKIGGTEYVYAFVTKAQGKVETQSFDWDWGYRLGVSLRIPIVHWEMKGTYTHFATEDQEGREESTPSFLISFKEKSISSDFKTRSSYKIDYNNVSISIEQSSFFSRLFGLSTELGLRKSYINQKEQVIYEGMQKVCVKDWCHFNGVGPFFGLKLKWSLISNISLRSSVSVFLMYGEFKAGHAEDHIDLQGSTHLLVPGIRFFSGFNWDLPMKWIKWSFLVGYEGEYFWRQNQSVDIKNNTIGELRIQLVRYAEDLTFYGLTTRFGLEF